MSFSRPMFGYGLACFALLFFAANGYALSTEPKLADPEQQALYEQLIEEVRCLVCQNQPIADSSAPLASDLRREIRRLLEEGQDEQSIKLFLTERYGDFVLYRPRFGGASLFLWLAPAILLLIGLITLARILRRRATLPLTDDADVTSRSADRSADR